MRGKILHIRRPTFLFKKRNYYHKEIVRVRGFLEPGDMVRVGRIELVTYYGIAYNAFRLVLDQEEFYILAVAVGESPSSRMQVN